MDFFLTNIHRGRIEVDLLWVRHKQGLQPRVYPFTNFF